ncbi:dihydroneopterin aldolase [Bacillaceae bacterium Marseille-Q3522]|nr:dihydroneopterin aldolase [Bacillaceae bacterium Marseille-Q3522]
MDKIFLQQMEFYGYHGVLPEESRLGQRFYVDLTVEANLKRAARTDNLEYSIDYGDLFRICKEIVEGKPFKLIESVAEAIATSILNDFPTVNNITVKVIKTDPPIPGHYRSVAVEIKRGRGNVE